MKCKLLLKSIVDALSDDEIPKCSKSIFDTVPEDVNRIVESVQSELSEAEANDVAASGRKRKRVSTRQRYEICENCEKEYDVTLNRKVEEVVKQL